MSEGEYPPLPRGYRWRRRPFFSELWWLLSLPLILFVTLPMASLLLQTTPAQMLANLREPSVNQAILLSLRTSFTAAALTILIGTPAAYLVARRDFPGKRGIDTLLDLPTVLPPAVAGVALLMAFGRRGPVGTLLELFDVQLTFTPVAVVLAQMFVAAPFFLRAAIVGFAAIDTELEQSAALDGASEWQIFNHVVLPLSRNALLSGTAMMWARAMGEFGATIIFAGSLPGRTQTMPLAIYIGFELDLGAALTLAVILMALSFLVLVTVRVFLDRSKA